jgi:serine/threonine-protein kinase RIO1
MSSDPLGMDGRINNVNGDLPFLVTQYLSSFAAAPRITDSDGNEEAKVSHHDAIDRIRKATNDIAAAFADLGSFGITLEVRNTVSPC